MIKIIYLHLRRHSTGYLSRTVNLKPIPTESKFPVTPPPSNRFPTELGNIDDPSNVSRWKENGGPMVTTPLKAKTLWHIYFDCWYVRQLFRMPSDFIERSTTRSTCCHIKHLHIHVNTFEGCFSALLESPEKLWLPCPHPSKYTQDFNSLST